jgi:hypothetical protein
MAAVHSALAMINGEPVGHDCARCNCAANAAVDRSLATPAPGDSFATEQHVVLAADLTPDWIAEHLPCSSHPLFVADAFDSVQARTPADRSLADSRSAASTRRSACASTRASRRICRTPCPGCSAPAAATSPPAVRVLLKSPSYPLPPSAVSSVDNTAGVWTAVRLSPALVRQFGDGRWDADAAPGSPNFVHPAAAYGFSRADLTAPAAVRAVDLATQAARAYEAAVGESAGDWMVRAWPLLHAS